MPGPRDPYLTPYAVPFGRAVAEGWRRRVVMVLAAQMGKTDTVFDVIGERLDTRPSPGIYVGPSKEFLTDQFEPRLMAMLDEAPRLRGKVARGKRNKKTLKLIAGVPLRLVHAGSSTAMKAAPAAWAIIDEYEEMGGSVRGQGDVLGLVEARGNTYADFVTGVISTPGRGNVATEVDETTGLLMWRVAEAKDCESPTWRLWQGGTRHHFVWACPHCGADFVPRFALLRWPPKSSPSHARRTAWVECPHCDERIHEHHKAGMNAGGVYVAPGGHRISIDGEMDEPLPDTSTVSFWASGLASPFRTFGDRAEQYLLAAHSGETANVQTALNAEFGELFVPGAGEAPEWKEVAALRGGYMRGEVPDGVHFLTMGVDVQKDRLYWVIRGWGARATSWLIDAGELYAEGGTTEAAVWDALADMLTDTYEGLPIRVAFIDSGFRPGKPWQVPENRVYEFCRRFRRSAKPTKGHDIQAQPLRVKTHEVTGRGKIAKYGLDLVHLDTDHWKSWLFEKVRWPQGTPGAWHLPEDIDDDYCQQIVSETRTVLPSGRVSWRSRGPNHYLDCEAQAAAAGHLHNAQRLTRAPARDATPEVDGEGPEVTVAKRTASIFAPPPSATAADPYL